MGNCILTRNKGLYPDYTKVLYTANGTAGSYTATKTCWVCVSGLNKNPKLNGVRMPAFSGPLYKGDTIAMDGGYDFDQLTVFDLI